jgi:hypothetical protein
MTDPIETINRIRASRSAVMDDKPIIVSDNPGLAALITLTRNIGIVIGAIPLIVAMFGRRDANEIVAWVQSSDAAQLGGAIGAIGLTIYGAWKAYHNRQKLVVAADAADDAVAIVKRP